MGAAEREAQLDLAAEWAEAMPSAWVDRALMWIRFGLGKMRRKKAPHPLALMAYAEAASLGLVVRPNQECHWRAMQWKRIHVGRSFEENLRTMAKWDIRSDFAPEAGLPSWASLMAPVADWLDKEDVDGGCSRAMRKMARQDERAAIEDVANLAPRAAPARRGGRL